MNPIDQAVQILKQGGLVAFPTETVYGLGADARRSDAVNRIFAAKGRPSNNPLIVHIHDMPKARLYASHWPQKAQQLAERFWPGPLTLVVQKSDAISPLVTAGGSTVGLRIPNHPLALQLLRQFDGPLAAPSANRSTRISPTTAEHVRNDLAGRVDLILDGGRCPVGIESTVIDLTADPPIILRPGGLSKAQIEAAIGPISEIQRPNPSNQPAASPGQQEIHYAPTTPAFRFESHQQNQIPQSNVAQILIGQPSLRPHGQHHITLPNDPTRYARYIYAILRELDTRNLDAIYIQMPPDEPPWTAIRDRLRRASRPLD
ncbi:MAG: threonylcarbamoyl-AMP synthase [Phycisphaerales bacterium]|jgi:L-threonylcarbamoyladenylate synthase|nr:threonylcarbamoyl-AMP synthase [Phycisphaerales bacterium]